MTTPEKIQALKDQLQASRAKLHQAIANVEGAAWNTPVQSDGEQWTALQMVRHLQDSQKGLLGQTQRLMKGEVTVPPDFDIDRWNARIQTKTAEAEMSAEQALSNLAQSLEGLMALVETIQDEDWAKTGWQPGIKQTLALYDFVSLIASHEASHAEEIAQAMVK
jgi:hypothetical protein